MQEAPHPNKLRMLLAVAGLNQREAAHVTPEDVCEFLFSHGPWGGGALMGIYHTLIHEFGKGHVDTALSSC